MDQSPIKLPNTDASYADDRNDEALKEVMYQFLKNENNYPSKPSLSYVDA